MRRAGTGIDTDATHRSQIDHKSPVVQSASGDVVASRANSSEDFSASGKLYGESDIIHTGALGDYGRMAINGPVIHSTCVVVGVIAWFNYGTTQAVPQIFDLLW